MSNGPCWSAKSVATIYSTGSLFLSFYQKYIEQLKLDFPNTFIQNDVPALLSPNLISAQKLEISATAIAKIKAFIKVMFQLRSIASYQEHVLRSHPLFQNFAPPQNFSVLMSYDFHLTDSENPKLIEINTNASSSLMIHESHRANSLKNIFEEDRAFDKDILSCFENEIRLFDPNRKLKVIAIVDESPETQKLYIEFLLYQELFQKAGYHCLIVDPKDLKIKDQKLVHADGLVIDLVYNRNTDFYFSNDSSKILREAFLQKLACFSPNPFEYALLADKQRLFELSHGLVSLEKLKLEERSLINQVVLKSYDIASTEDKDWFWQNKKKLFFKPKRSFGGKAGYRGQGVTQSVYANILTGDYLAQDFAPPPTIHAHLEDGTELEFKYDLRFYVYRDRIQLGVARLWRGQMTNIHTLGGGITPLVLK
jgi:hypothetical protein